MPFKDSFAAAAAEIESASDDLAVKQQALDDANLAQGEAQSARDAAQARRDAAVAKVKEVSDLA